MDTYALLLAGNEPRHWRNIASFGNYLWGETPLKPLNTKMLFCHTLSKEEILKEVSETFCQAQAQQGRVVLLYAGHGGKGRFSPDGTIKNGIPYASLAQTIPWGVDFLFINDSCYSGSALRSFQRASLVPDYGSIIASSAEDELSMSIVEELIYNFRSRQLYTEAPNVFSIDTKVTEIEKDGKIILDLGPKIKKPYRKVLRVGKARDYWLFPK